MECIVSIMIGKYGMYRYYYDIRVWYVLIMECIVSIMIGKYGMYCQYYDW